MKPSYKLLERRNKALRERVAYLEKQNYESFERQHKAEVTIQFLEAENAELRRRELDYEN